MAIDNGIAEIGRATDEMCGAFVSTICLTHDDINGQTERADGQPDRRTHFIPWYVVGLQIACAFMNVWGRRKNTFYVQFVVIRNISFQIFHLIRRGISFVHAEHLRILWQTRVKHHFRVTLKSVYSLLFSTVYIHMLVAYWCCWCRWFSCIKLTNTYHIT